MKVGSKTAQPVIVMPAQAKSLDDARQQIEESRDFFQSVGFEPGRDIMKSAALTGLVSARQREALVQAGFQVLDDKVVEKTTKSAANSVRDLGPGWLFEQFPLVSGPFDPFAPLRPEPQPAPRRRALNRSSSEGPNEYTGELAATGRGVTIAVLDTGVAAHPDLGDRFLGNVSPIAANRGYHIGRDPVGHGTHVAGDAAGDGTLSQGALKGPAPEANILGIQVLSEGADPAPLSQVLDEFTMGVEWMVDNKDKYNIRVANMSLGFPLQLAMDRYSGARFLFDPIGAAIGEAIKAGIVVVAAAGNDGPGGRIQDSPGMIEDVITVGALDTNGTPAFKGDDSVAEFSSRGPTPDGRIKPDLVAPGVNILSANSPHSMISRENAKAAEFKNLIDQASNRELAIMVRDMVRSGMMPYDAVHLHPEEIRELLTMGLEVKDHRGRWNGDSAYIAMDGTSMATPIVSGVVAAMLEVNPSLTPAQVKAILKKTADPIRGERRTAQGSGALDAQEAVAWAAEMARRAG